MSDYLYQKIYFQETYTQYPAMIYNQILVHLIEKYEVKKILYSAQNFSVLKKN